MLLCMRTTFKYLIKFIPYQHWIKRNRKINHYWAYSLFLIFTYNKILVISKWTYMWNNKKRFLMRNKSFRSFTTITFISSCIVYITTLRTFPVLRTWNKTFRLMQLVAFFTSITPIKIWKTTLTTQPLHWLFRIRSFRSSFPLSWTGPWAGLRSVVTFLLSRNLLISHNVLKSW